MDGRTTSPVDKRTSPRRRALLHRVRQVLSLFVVGVGAVASLATNLADDGTDKAVEEGGVITCEQDEECAQASEVTPFCLERYNLCVECLEDEHCGEQERCHEYACVDHCEDSTGCAGDLVCIEGLCRTCSEDAHCGDPSAYCYIGPEQSACRPLCKSSDECSGPGYAEGDVCRGGRCQLIECSSAQQCLLDREICNPQTGSCQPLL